MPLARVYKTRWFTRWARREGLRDSLLCAAVEEIEDGLVEASLGGRLFKKRIAQPGRGKRGGFRTIVVLQHRRAAFFVYGFAKNARDNIRADELEALRKLAREMTSYDEKTLARVLESGAVIEVVCNAEAK